MRRASRKFSPGFWNQSLCQKPTHFVSETLPSFRIFCYFVLIFWKRLWLQTPLQNFSCVTRIRSEYVKHSPRSEKCNALCIMTVRPTKHFLLKNKWLSSGFLKFKSLKFRWASEYFVILCGFLATTLTSEAHRNFFMRRLHAFWVCKTFS